MKEPPSLFKGVLVPALTPFHPDLSVNRPAFLEHCRWLLEQGVAGLAVFGTTGEANSLSVEERIELLEFLVDSGIPTERLMPGTGTCALPDNVRLTRHAVALGCAGVLMLPPFYYKDVSDEGLYAAYAEVIQQVGSEALRLYLYHIPPIARVPISLGLIGRLIKGFPDTVVGIKDSSGDWNNTRDLLREFPGFAVFSGSENFLLATLRGGGAGCITATGNVNPAGICRVFENREGPGADELQAVATRVRDVFQAFPLIPGLKQQMSRFTEDPDWRNVRPPLIRMAEEAAEMLHERLWRVGFEMRRERG